MGQEILCTAHWEGNSVRGKALLESSEILFRGEPRLKIPLSTIRSATATNGELRLKTDRGLVVFDLGERAEKWREKIANPKSAIEKLGVKPGETVAVFGAIDPEFLKNLKAQKSAVEKDHLASEAASIFLAAPTRDALSQIKKIAAKMNRSAALWLVYPKGQKSITESDVLAAGRAAALKDVKVVAFNSTHTALKFVYPLSKR